MISRHWTALVCALTVGGLVYAHPMTPAAQRQRSSVSLDASALEQPLWLSVSAPGAQLDGRVTLDGRHLATLRQSNLRTNISPHLSRGQHRLSVSGSVRPPSATVSLELIGVGLQVSQQSAGNSQLDREIILNVR